MIRILLGMVFILVVGGCELSQDSVGTPMCWFTEAPFMGETLGVDTVVFEWEGNENVVEFSWMIDSSWSEWGEVLGCTLLLGEGEHIFAVRSRNLLKIEEDAFPERLFWVDAIDSNGVWFSPRRIEVNPYHTVQCSVFLEDCPNFMGGRFRFSYDPASIVVEDFLSCVEDAFMLVVQVTGEVEVSFGVTSGDTLPVGSLPLFSFSVLTQEPCTTYLRWIEVDLRDTLNVPISADGGLWDAEIVVE